MSDFKFEPINPPFPRWMGPYSPSRGNKTGFRIKAGKIKTWCENGAEWPVVECPGVMSIVKLITEHWKGGRTLFLPNGFVVKPLQEKDEVSERVLVGRFWGNFKLKTAYDNYIHLKWKHPKLSESTSLSQTIKGVDFDLGHPGKIKPGTLWPGPKTTGLECQISSDGELTCTWYHPNATGQIEIKKQIRGPDLALAAGFHAARPKDAGGRVRITANGHVITNREQWAGWAPLYVGLIDPKSWTGWEKWIGKEST